MGRLNPGGDPGEIMYDVEGAIGLTDDGKTLRNPERYTDADRKWLESVVRNRGGIEKFSKENRGHISAVLGLSA